MNIKQNINKLVKSLDDMKSLDINVLDVRGYSDFTDYMIFATATSGRHVRAIVYNILDKVPELQHFSIEGMESGEWVLVDFGDIVLHIMLADAREFYNLEGMWSRSAKYHVHLDALSA